MKLSNVPYERFVQWSAGPIAILAGWLATQITTHIGIFGSLGLGKSQWTHAIVTAVTFAVGAGVTYMSHHKWLSNLAIWWDKSGLPVPAGIVTPTDPPPEPTPPLPPLSTSGAGTDEAARLRAQLIAAGLKPDA